MSVKHSIHEGHIIPNPWHPRAPRTQGFTGADRYNPEKPSRTARRKANRLSGNHKPHKK